MNSNECYRKLWLVLSKILLLSHGQASVERWFSVNKEISEYTMSEHTLIARRVIKDHIRHLEGARNLEISKELLQSCQGARQKYHAHRESQQLEDPKRSRLDKRKPFEAEVEVMRKKQKQLKMDMLFQVMLTEILRKQNSCKVLLT